MQRRPGSSLITISVLEVGYQTLNDWWTARAEPWLRSRDPHACWRQAAVDACVVPTKSFARALQHLIAGLPFPVFGVEVLTPYELRAALLAHLNLPTARVKAEDLACLRDYLESCELSAGSSLASLISNPRANWLNTLAHLKSAGGHLPLVWAQLDQKLQTLLNRADMPWPAEQDGQLRKAVSAYQGFLRFNNCFFLGFEAHAYACPNWLEAACKLSSQVHVSIPELPEDTAGQLGYRLCETLLGEAQLVDTAQAVISADSIALGCEYCFLDSIEQEAEAICRSTIRFLNNADCERLGIVVGRDGPLSRLVAHKLESAGIAFHDGVGSSFAPLDRAQQAFKAWLTWAQRPNVPNTQALIRQWRTLGLMDGQSAQQALRNLSQGADQALTTHL
ncbi:MAG TPA: hypothetical protein PLV25_03175, partial [Opitutales bacterium]|nr:hypothetical protein [Opitutales bacterium]